MTELGTSSICVVNVQQIKINKLMLVNSNLKLLMLEEQEHTTRTALTERNSGRLLLYIYKRFIQKSGYK